MSPCMCTVSCTQAVSCTTIGDVGLPGDEAEKEELSPKVESPMEKVARPCLHACRMCPHLHVAAGSRQATSQVQGRPHHRFKAGHITNAYRFKAGSRQATSPDHAISPHTLCIRSRALPVPVQTPHRHDPPCARADPPPKGGAGGSLHHGADRAQF